MRWPWTRPRIRPAGQPRVAKWDPDRHEGMVQALADAAAASDSRCIILLTQSEDGTVGFSVWGSEACALNVETVGLLTHGLEAAKRRQADWWDE